MNIQPPNSNNEDRQNAGTPVKGKRSFDLGEQTFEFAQRIVDLCEKSPNKLSEAQLLLEVGCWMFIGSWRLDVGGSVLLTSIGLNGYE